MLTYFLLILLLLLLLFLQLKISPWTFIFFDFFYLKNVKNTQGSIGISTLPRGAARAAACPPDCGTTSVVVADVWELIVTAGGGAH